MMIFFPPCFDPVGEYIYILIYNDMFRYSTELHVSFRKHGIFLKFQGTLGASRSPFYNNGHHGPHWLPTWALAYVGTSPEYHPGWDSPVKFGWDENPKNIWWQRLKTQEKKPKTDEKTRRWTKKHTQVLKHLPHQAILQHLSYYSSTT